MTDIILHQYPESPFAEKIRLLLGYKRASYRAVTIPVIMPKPDLMPLTGGYRKTPVMQIGADIYCDTALISRVIETLLPEPPVLGGPAKAADRAACYWTDTAFFRIAVSVAFQPKALAASPLFQDPAAAQAFVEDRTRLAGGGSLGMDPSEALPAFEAHLRSLDAQLSGADFLGGDAPVMLDFCTYHCCWFVFGNSALRDLFEPHPALSAWMERMTSFGHGEMQELPAADALSIAREATPVSAPAEDTAALDGCRVGDEVTVSATDYGTDPVSGVLMRASLDSVSLLRDDKDVGNVAVHFPRLGFRLQKLGAE